MLGRLLTILIALLSTGRTAVGESGEVRRATPVSAAAAEGWRADLKFMVAELQRVHPNPFHDVSRADFLAAADRLGRSIPALSREQIIVELARLTALVGEGHTQLGLAWNRDGKIGFGRYPLSLYLFSDGLFVRAAAPDLAYLVGGRVIKIGHRSAAEAMATVTPIVQHDNEMTVKDVLPARLVIPEVLYALGICESSAACTYVVEQPGGRRSWVELRRLAFGGSVEWAFAPGRPRRPDPLYLQHQGENYWFEYLAQRRTLYVQYNVVGNSAKETVKQFFERAYRVLDEKPVDKLIVDLRLNNGGDNTLNGPVTAGIAAHPEINRRGKLFVVIGRLTFSAGMNCATDLERKTRAIFAGEPTGSRPNQYGDAADVVLPHSGITVRISTRYWGDGGPADHRPWIAPAIPIALSSEDYRDGRDPVLEKILATAIVPVAAGRRAG